MARAVFPTLTVPLVTVVVSHPSRNVENAARLPTAPKENRALRGPAELFCPKGLSVRRMRTASLDAVLEKFIYGQVAYALAKENPAVYHKESGARNTEWLVVNPTNARKSYLAKRENVNSCLG